MNSDIKNIIIISIDSLRADCIGANLDKKLLDKFNLKTKLKTPTLDWFVNNGIFFNQCISAAPYTTASHASILTGQWPTVHGVKEFFTNKLRSQTILNILKRKGFKTLFQTDFPYLLGPVLGFTRGIDKFITGRDDQSLSWIEENVKNQLACFFHFANVHFPYGFLNLYWGGDNFRKKVKHLLNKLNLKPDENNNFLFCAFSELSKEEEFLLKNYRHCIYEMHKRGLYSEIMDLYIEGINYFEKKRFSVFIKNLKKIGILDNSILVLTSDHGEIWNQGDRGHYDRSYNENVLSDDVIVVPLIFFGPGLPKQKIIKNQVRSIDIIPTILSILGIKTSQGRFDGCSLFPFEKISSNLVAHSQLWSLGKGKLIKELINESNINNKLPKTKINDYLSQESIRLDGWKLVVSYINEGKVSGLKLFDVREGEKERSDGERVKKLRYNLSKFKKFNQKNILNNISVEDIEKQKIANQLRSIGYNV